jgi:hypothetical protein
MNAHTFNEIYKDMLYCALFNSKSLYENQFNLLSNLPYIRKQRNNHITIQEIFKHSWDDFKAACKSPIKQSIIDNVESMIDCRDLSKGHLFLECSDCENFHLVGLSCKSRFCASCGHKYRDARSIEIQKKLINVTHRHFVFSVPFELRPLFWKCRDLFDILFKSVNEALHRVLGLSKKDKKNDYRLGFVSFLHTSGRSLNMHPHLHVLIAEALVDKFGNQKRHYYFPFEALRKTFMFRFFINANKCLKNFGDKELYREFNILRTKIVREYKDGFYTHGPKAKELINEESKISSLRGLAKYIARYASHPPLAESNILKFDKESNLVTWKYLDYELGEDIIVTEHVFSFIKKLIRHILGKGFHQIRYFGFYSNKTSRIKDKPKLLKDYHVRDLKNKLYWRIMLLETFGYDPMLCYCGGTLSVNYEMSLLPIRERDDNYG